MGYTLSPDHETFVAAEIGSGRYRSADEVVRAALEHWRATGQASRELSAEVRRRIERVDGGEGVEVDSAGLKSLFDEIKADARNRRIDKVETE